MDNPPIPPVSAIATEATVAVSEQQKNTVLLVYLLQAVSFFIPFSSIAGVIVNYLKRDEVQGTWLESHVRWQIKTFWYFLLGWLVGLILLIVVIGILVWGGVLVWYIYRIIKGWLAFNEGKELPDAIF